MAVHFFHTSDWHLGQLFFNYSRQYEHEQFLTWLLAQIKQKQPHALFIAGDIFDVINPSAQAQKQLYQFLSDAHQLAPHMQTLIIAGNHDSGYRIEQVEPLLAKYNARTVGVIHKTEDGTIDFEHLIVPIYDTAHHIIAWCVALPFLRSAEITGLNEFTQDSKAAIQHLHDVLITKARTFKTDEQALIVMSHAHMQGGETSDSERPIIIGNEEALPTTLFGNDIDYVALGHLHKPQKVGQEHIRYSGSPIPLSFSEINYKHQIVDVRIDPTQTVQSRYQYTALPIPRCVELRRIHGELTQVFQQLHALPDGEIDDIDQRTYLDIEYHTNTPPQPNLRQQFEDALPKNRYRLVRISRRYLIDEQQQPSAQNRNLEPPTPEQLFWQLWQKQGYQEDESVSQDFLSLVEQAQQLLENEKVV